MDYGIIRHSCRSLRFFEIQTYSATEKRWQNSGAKLIVYAGEDDEYFTFISSEAYYELEKWKQYRIPSGEPVILVDGMLIDTERCWNLGNLQFPIPQTTN